VCWEVYEDPGRALSDGPSQIPLKDLTKHLRMLKAIHAAVSWRPLRKLGPVRLAVVDFVVDFDIGVSDLCPIKKPQKETKAGHGGNNHFAESAKPDKYSAAHRARGGRPCLAGL